MTRGAAAAASVPLRVLLRRRAGSEGASPPNPTHQRLARACAYAGEGLVASDRSPPALAYVRAGEWHQARWVGSRAGTRIRASARGGVVVDVAPTGGVLVVLTSTLVVVDVGCGSRVTTRRAVPVVERAGASLLVVGHGCLCTCGAANPDAY